jgi:hypothetical protein
MIRALAVPALVVASACLCTPSAAAQRTDELQIQKLKLEIAQLKENTDDEATWLRPYAPVVIAAFVAGVGVFRWRREQRLAHKLRVEEQIARNLERIVDAPSETGGFSGRAIAALRNLDAITSEPDAQDAQRARVTETLGTMIDQDLIVLDTPSKARFPAICLSHWPPYRDGVDADRCKAILARYRRTLQGLKATNGSYLSAVRYVGGAYDAGGQSLDEADFALFRQVAAGYEAHLALLDEQSRAQEAAAFGNTLGNQDIAEQRFRGVLSPVSPAAP